MAKIVETGGEPKRAPRNKTLFLTEAETNLYRKNLIRLKNPATAEEIFNRTIHQNIFGVLPLLPEKTFDLLFADPPYNLTKNFGENAFRQISNDDYETWLNAWLAQTARLLKPNASVYICGDWRSSAAIERVGTKYFRPRNRITWEREKGRGALKNWKNASEDIWFFTVSDDYVFNAEAVKVKRKVLAPYRENGAPKDWDANDDGNFRATSASNLWTDLTVPFWSMPENTQHPTQKPEKLLAKIILASTNEGDSVLDPFAGSGTTGVVARKLNRNFTLVEMDENYCLLAEKRLALADKDGKIQGFADGVFWERNANIIKNGKKSSTDEHG